MLPFSRFHALIVNFFFFADAAATDGDNKIYICPEKKIHRLTSLALVCFYFDCGKKNTRNIAWCLVLRGERGKAILIKHIV